MILLSLLLVLAALGLLIGGLGAGDVHLVWGSVGASVVAGVCLAAAAASRRGPVDGEPADEDDPDGAVARPRVAASARAQIPAAESGAARPRSAWPATGGPEPDGAPVVSPLTSKIAGKLAHRSVSPVAPRGRLSEPPPRRVPPPVDAPAAVSTADSGEPEPDVADVDPDLGIGRDRGRDSYEDADLIPADEPSEEDCTLTDSVLVVDLDDEVLVVDGRPRYHLFFCTHLAGRDAVSLPLREARDEGFTPCDLCRPDSTVAAALRIRRRRRLE